MAKQQEPDVQGLLARAVTLGREIAALGQPAARRLSREAWRAKNLELAAGADIEGTKRVMATLPRLQALATYIAQLAIDGQLHAPTLHGQLSDPERYAPAAWELLRANLSDAAASAAVNSLIEDRVDEIGAHGFFGAAVTGLEAQERENQIQAELAELDAELFNSIKLSDVVWEAGSSHVRWNGSLLVVDEITHASMASYTAEQARINALPLPVEFQAAA